MQSNLSPAIVSESKKKFRLVDRMRLAKDSKMEVIMEIMEPIIAPSVPYWTSELYSFGKYIRKYGFYPMKWPILLHTDHSGPHTFNSFNEFEINNTSEVMMFHSPNVLKHWRASYRKKSFCLYSPFVFYRKTSKILPSPDARGTLAYPAHTIPELDDVSDLETYVEQLKALPEQYHPVSISLHYHDVNKGIHNFFLDKGFEVYTAGNPSDYTFCEKFYALLRNFKYSTSNILGSYTFYSVEMGIPFFLYGEQPIYQSNTDSELAKIALESVKVEDQMSRNLIALFERPTTKVSREQRLAVNESLGLNDGASRPLMALLLYGLYFKAKMKSAFKRVRGKLK